MSKDKQARMAKLMEELDANPNPWYKEPWPWILMSGPAIAVVACIITIYLAFSTGANEEIGGAVKRGLVIEAQKEASQTDAPAGVKIPKEVMSGSDKKEK